MIIKGLLILIFLLSLSYVIKAETIEVTAITNVVNGGAEVYKPIVNEFNEYAKEKGLGIHVELNLLTYENSTLKVGDYESSLEATLKKKSTKYDIIFYDRIFTHKFGPYLVDLKKYLPEDHFKLYESGIASKTCVYDKKWVGLPMNVDILVLYYNNDLLKKYNKEIPKTWNELIGTSKFITEKEKEANNSTVISFIPFLNVEPELNTCIYYEFIYTFREKVDSPFPSFDSKEAKEALETLKKIKDEIASDDIFKNSMFYLQKMFEDLNFLFMYNWYFPSMGPYFTFSPGKNSGVSGSVTGGYNVGINNSIDSKKIDASVQFIKFVTSKEKQKEIVMKNKVFSAIPELYDDEEVCKEVDCEKFKNIQLVSRPTQLRDYSSFSELFRNSISDFLFNGKASTDTLKEISKKYDSSSSYIKKSYYGLFIYFIVYFTIYLFINV